MYTGNSEGILLIQITYYELEKSSMWACLRVMTLARSMRRQCGVCDGGVVVWRTRAPRLRKII